MPEVVLWEKIKSNFTDTLLLGNGASIAVHKKFNYNSLYKAAEEKKYISSARQEISTKEVFEAFNSEDFELVLRRLWQATLVNKALKIKSDKVEEAYNLVQSALIKTVKYVHIEYQQAQPSLLNIAKFIKHFKTVISLNYDLIVYWAAMYGKDKFPKWGFKDCFIKNTFSDDWRYLRNPCGEQKGVTLFFYPHGNLVLCQSSKGVEKKIVCADTDLLTKIFSQWAGKSVPIFVCEGTPEHKKQAIKRSNYLTRVFEEVIPEQKDSLAIYGWSFSTQDQHLMDKLKKAKIERIAVSVHGKNREYIEESEKKLKRIGAKEIIFYKADSRGCWCTP